MLQNNPKLKSLIISLWDTFWSGGIANPLTAIEQITYLLFIKRLDDLEARREKYSKNAKSVYRSKFTGKYLPSGAEKGEERSKSELRWSEFRSMPADEMLFHVRYNVFPFLKSLNGEISPFTKYMENAVFILEKPSLLVEAIKKIEEIFVEIEKDAEVGGHSFQDIQGDVYEMLLSEIGHAGKNGQFRTPRHIIKLMTELVEPKLNNTIADPACGTSGFLLGAYQYILTELVRKKDPSKLVEDEDGFERGLNSAILSNKQKSILEESLFGFDMDTTMVRLGLMNLMMHGIDNPQIEYKDTLSNSFDEKEKFDIVLANPPFTGKIDRKDINPNLRIDSGSTELLFLVQILRMLREGGKAAVIIPEGVLFGSNNAQKLTREIILKDSKLEAVISLPSGAFKPYTGVKTAILIFTKVKDESEKWNTKKVWFYSVESDGYSLDESRRKLKENPLPNLIDAFKTRKKSIYKDRKNYFFVDLNEIQENDLDLSYNRYKEFEYVEEKYDPPREILSQLVKLEDKILLEIRELNGLIG